MCWNGDEQGDRSVTDHSGQVGVRLRGDDGTSAVVYCDIAHGDVVADELAGAVQAGVVPGIVPAGVYAARQWSIRAGQ